MQYKERFKEEIYWKQFQSFHIVPKEIKLHKCSSCGRYKRFLLSQAVCNDCKDAKIKSRPKHNPIKPVVMEDEEDISVELEESERNKYLLKCRDF